MQGKNFKVGIFVLGTILLLVYMVLRVSQGSLFQAGTYSINMEIDSAVGIDKKTGVQIAGVSVGEVIDIKLLNNNKAVITLAIRDNVIVSPNAQAMIKTTGILGDAYIEIYQPGSVNERIKEGSTLKNVVSYGDFNSVTQKIGAIADDVKAVTTQMKKLMAGDDSAFDKTVKNLEILTDSLAKMTKQNEKSIDVIVANMKALSQNLNYLVAKNVGSIDRTVYNIEDITSDLADGKGTIGKLLKDEETVNKLNDTLEGINTFIGGANRTKIDLGMHTEYLVGTGDVKNYVSMEIKPRPDKFFLIEVVSDPDPSFSTSVEETIVTAGNTTSTITTKRREKALDGIMLSAQLAKKYKDFTIRGGLIESSGGVGLDYERGPIGLSFTAFDFKSDEGQRPHLKVMGKTHLTKSLYVLGGVDDFINSQQDLAWFLGAGLSFTDDDIKSLIGVFSSVGTASMK